MVCTPLSAVLCPLEHKPISVIKLPVQDDLGEVRKVELKNMSASVKISLTSYSSALSRTYAILQVFQVTLKSQVPSYGTDFLSISRQRL